jgi:hypothetical protein
MAATRSKTRNLEQELQLAQLERHQLESKQLRQALNDNGKSKPLHTVLGQFVPLITALVAVAGFIWGVYQYQVQQNKSLEAQKLQSKQELKTAERDFMKPWLDNQREIYLQALTAASIVANSDNPDEVANATEEFWVLYHGKMILFETGDVEKAMIAFGGCIKNACDRARLDTQLHQLASAMAGSMSATAKMTYDEYSAQQVKYLSEASGGQ